MASFAREPKRLGLAARCNHSREDAMNESRSFMKLSPSHPRIRRFVQVLLITLLIVMVALLVERLRGQWALQHWKNEMTARGEVFDVAAVWPPASDDGSEFSNRMEEAISKLPRELRYYYVGALLGIVS